MPKLNFNESGKTIGNEISDSLWDENIDCFVNHVSKMGVAEYFDDIIRLVYIYFFSVNE